MTNDKLITRLRDIRSGNVVDVACELDDLCIEAANALEAQLAERMKAERERDEWRNYAGEIQEALRTICDEFVGPSGESQIEDIRRVMNEFRASGQAAEARLAEAEKVIEPLARICLPFTLSGECVMIPATIVKTARAFLEGKQ